MLTKTKKKGDWDCTKNKEREGHIGVDTILMAGTRSQSCKQSREETRRGYQIALN